MCHYNLSLHLSNCGIYPEDTDVIWPFIQCQTFGHEEMDRSQWTWGHKLLPPSTKCSDKPEDAYWSRQSGAADPEKNFDNHIIVNNPPPNGPLFGYKHGNRHKALTCKDFLDQLNNIAVMLGLESLKGHGLQIGGTLEYLLQGVPFNVVKSLGCWSSEAFVIYLRQHAVIMAPYLQSSPVLETFTRYTMPPVRN